MKKSEVFVYIAGKYTDDDLLSTEHNIAAALDLAIVLAKNNIKYFCPHTHSRLMDYYAPSVSWEYWMDLDTHVIRNLTNCMLLVHNYTRSKGAMQERDLAITLGHRVFSNIDEFFAWYSSLED